MDRDYRYGRKQQLIHCKEPMRMHKNDVVVRLDHIALGSILQGANCWREVEHQDCRSFSAGKLHLQSEVYRGSTCNSFSPLPKVSDSRYAGLNCELPCAHLCIIGEKLILHKRNHVQSSIFARARNYSRCLKKSNNAEQQQYRARTQRKHQFLEGRKAENDALKNKSPHIHVPQVINVQPSYSRCSSSSTDSVGTNRYLIYHGESIVNENPVVGVSSSRESMVNFEKSMHRQKRNGVALEFDSGCSSYLSFSSVDLTTTCRTPDGSSRIMSPLPARARGLYPVACPAYPMIESFPACVIPEPDIFLS